MQHQAFATILRDLLELDIERRFIRYAHLRQHLQPTYICLRYARLQVTDARAKVALAIGSFIQLITDVFPLGVQRLLAADCGGQTFKTAPPHP